MGYAIELCFDQKSEEKLAGYWRLLHESGVGSYMYESAGRPHIALAVFGPDLDNIKGLCAVMKDYFHDMTAFNVLFSSLGIFPTDEGVSFLSPVVTKELLSLHEDLYGSICDHNLEKSYIDYYKPGRWVPHCTMTIKTSGANQMKGLDILRQRFSPMEVKIEDVVLVEFSPVRYIDEIKLK